jgi:hypothetical protein
VQFNIDGSWDCELTVTPEVEDAFNQVFRPNDELACVRVDQKLPGVLRVSFDLDAGDYDDVIIRGLEELRKAATSAGLPGSPVHIVAMTDEGQARWTRGPDVGGLP